MTQADRDQQYMTLALRLAAKGRGRTSPNPMVGAVVVTAAGLIVGQGYHRRAGGPHAEVFALRQAGRRTAGATLYVTLEPCGHTNKRTPPCVPLIQASGVRRVVVAQIDPNPLVSGRGIRKLRAAGLSVDIGCCAQQARRLNIVYSHWMETGRPFVTLKAGMTLDGKIATASGESRWITGEAARRDAHRQRSRVDAVLVGIGTVLRDDPTLTARVSDHPLKLASRQPIRIVVDSRLRIPLKARVLSRTHDAHTLIATTRTASTRKLRSLRRQGIDVLVVSGKEGRVSLADLCRQLGRLKITSLLVEGGSAVNASLIRSNLVDRVVLYIAPRLLGGDDAKSVIGGASPKHLHESLLLEAVTIRRAGRDMVIEADVHHQ